MSSGGGAHGARVVEPADAAVLAFLDQLSPEDAARFFLLRRSAIPTETVATLIRPMLPPTIADDTVQSFVVAVSGAAKAFAVQLAEAARETAGDGAITGPRMVRTAQFSASHLASQKPSLPYVYSAD